MTIAEIQKICKSLPDVTEDIKWGADLCFMIGNKMFCVMGVEGDFGVSLKVKDEEFEELCERKGISIAPYVGRYKWILITDPKAFSKKEWAYYIKQSYELILSKQGKKKKAEVRRQK